MNGWDVVAMCLCFFVSGLGLGFVLGNRGDP